MNSSLAQSEVQDDPSAVARYEKYRRATNVDGMKAGMLQAAVLVPPFILLDLFLIPDHFVAIQIARVITMTCIFAVIAAIDRRRSWVEQYSDEIWFAIAWIIGVFCAACCWAHTGYDSVYSFSLMFVFMSSALSICWPARLSAICNALIYLTYITPLLLGIISINDVGMTLGFQLFLLGIVGQTVMMHRRRYESESREYFTNEALQRTKASLEDAYSQLQELDKLKSEFFANISHELRTPLTLIIAPVDELLASLQPSRERDVLKVVRRNASRLLRMIDDLLDLARLEAGGLRLQVRQFDLTETAERVAENAQRAAEARGITFTFDSQAEKGEMYGDPHRIEIVLTNLIGNAVKFTPDDGRIEVRVRSDEHGATAEVQDTGPGIPKDALDKVFERFFQVQGSERRRHGGAGIGLALAKELAELHGGSLTVTSEPGQGATFKLFIPWGRSHFENDVMERRQVQVTAHPGRRAEDRLSSVPPSATAISLQAVSPQTNGDPILLDGGRRAKILVAEDEEDLREFIVSSLSRDFDIRAARDGAEALRLLAEERPDLVLTDIMMPNTSGFDLCRAIKDDPMLKHVPVILLTARGESETALEGFGVGADDFVAKPFHPQVLGARIRAHLENRALSLRLADQARLASAGTLAAGLAHEVKNPINAIVNAARVLKTGGSGKVSNDKLLQVVIEGVERINSIVSVIERHARPADGTELAACNVQDGIESTLELLEHRLHEVTVHRDFQLAEAVSAPARALNQVLMNLLDNAIRSGAKNLWIELGQHADQVVVAVADDGPGVPQDLVQRIFDPFFTTRQEGEGTGLGLHLSRRIAKDCGGELRYEPRPGGGARFVMEIPAMERAA